MQVIETIKIDLKNKSNITVNAKQLDSKSRFIQIEIVEDGTPKDLTNHTVRIYALKPDGTKIFNDCTVLDALTGKVSVELTNQVLAKSGFVNCELSIFGSDESILTSQRFLLNVDNTIRDDNAIESSNEFNALINALNGVGSGGTGTGGTGTDGKSAYEIALENGFVGTEVEWLTSLQGDTGLQGPQGDIGPQGLQGPQGIKGDTGSIGPQGVQGPKGDTGAQGSAGYTPVKGVDYFDGIQGPKGDTGATGPQGAQGLKGDTGVQGPQGNAGYTPVKGTDYFTTAEITQIKSDTKVLVENDINKYLSVVATSNIFTFDLSQYYNFAIETTDTNAKTIAFANIPSTSNMVISIAVKLKYTNASAMTFPASVVWQNTTIPTFTTGKQYLLLFMSYDDGTTWLGYSTGAW